MGFDKTVANGESNSVQQVLAVNFDQNLKACPGHLTEKAAHGGLCPWMQVSPFKASGL